MTSENSTRHSGNFDCNDSTDSEDYSSSSSSSEYSSESKDDTSTDSEAEIQALQAAYNNMNTPIPNEIDEKDINNNISISYDENDNNNNNNNIESNTFKSPHTPAPFKALPPLKSHFSMNNASLTIQQENTSLKQQINDLQKQNKILISKLSNQRTYKYSEKMNCIRNEIHLQKCKQHINRQKIDINAKYIKMKTLKISKNVIINRMKLDGLSELYIDTFFCENNNNNNKYKDKMKHIHWKAIKYDKLKDSIWNKINHKWNDYDIKIFSLKFQIRKNKPPKLNKYVLNKKINRLHSKGNVLNGSNGNGNKINKLKINKKRWEEIQIGLKLFNMTNEQLRNIILSLNEKKMDINKINNLINIIPTAIQQLEIEKISLKIGYEEIRNFDIVERFFYSLYDIIELKQRLKKWIFKLKFETLINKLISNISIIENAKVNIILSKELLIIFTVLLKFGNHMNYNNKRNSNAYGFIISDLMLLNQIKTFDNSMTFTMYLYSFIEKKYPNLLDNIIKKFEIMYKASEINSDIIYNKYENINKEINDLNDMIIRHNEEYFQHDKNDLFIYKMTKFQNIIKDNINKLDNKMKSLNQCEIQLKKYFAYNNKITIQNIFKHIVTFINMLKESKIKLKQFEENRKIRNLNKKKKKKKYQFNRSNRSNTDDLNRNSMKKYTKKTTKQYALSMEDIGTPLVDDKKQVNYDSIIYLFDEQKETKQLKPVQSSQSNSDFDSDSDYEMDYNKSKYEPKYNSNCKIKLKINLDVKYNSKMRRNSDPSTTTPTSTNSMINNKLADRINMFESNIKNEKQKVNKNKNKNKNKNNKLLKPGFKKGNNNNDKPNRRRRTRTFASQFVEKVVTQSK